VEHSPLFTQNSGDGAVKRRRRRKRGGPAVASRRCCWRFLTGERLGRWPAFLLLLRVFFSALCFSVSVFFFSVFILLAASVSCLSFLLVFLMVAAVVGGATVVPDGDAAVCFLPPRAEAQASVSLYFSSSHFSASSSIFGR